MSTLVIISPLHGALTQNGKIVLPGKFIDSMKLSSELWGGKLLHICAPGPVSDSLDNLEVDPDLPEFKTVCEPITAASLMASIPKNSIVVASGENSNFISATCAAMEVPSVYVTETTLRTRLQICSENRRSLLHGMWAQSRQILQEVRQRKAMRLAAGVQCNGIPAFEACQKVNFNCHLFFDTRTTKDMLATAEQIANRSIGEKKKLRLTFSGRLTIIKGVDDLLKVAEELKKRIADNFILSVCGEGDYAQTMRETIKSKNLGDVVRMMGALDFKTELVPFIINETDIFICCHRQGDPSCTYLETMACGVPIMGYANEAWKSLHEFSNSGWVAPNKNYSKMAEKIAALTPAEIDKEASNSLRFASEHTFEKTTAARISHYRETFDNYFEELATM